jgi:O-antigen ligase
MAKKNTIRSEARAALIVAAILIVLATLIADGTLGLIVGFICFPLIVFAMALIPIRLSMLALAFFATVLPNPAEGQPTPWAPPFSVLGAVLLNHLNTLDRSGVLGMIPVSGMEILFGVLYLIYLRRRATRSRIDGEIVPVPQPLIELAKLALCAIGFTWLHGVVTGGDFSMSLWQVNSVLYMPIIFLLFQASLRGPEDHWAFARLYLAAGAYKCCLAMFVVWTIEVGFDPTTGDSSPPYGTAHADSMLFSFCFVIVLAGLIERVHKRWIHLAVLLLPILVLGTKANNRRLAWVELGIVLLMLYIVSRETPLKRNIRLAVYYSVPVALVYVIAGWNVQYSKFFKPVKMIRSVVDANSDGSSQWRELENFNILTTYWQHPIFGSGFGHPFNEVVQLPAVDYSLELYLPHNSFLGLWNTAGLVGFAGISALWVAGLYFAMRAYHAARNPTESTAAIVCFGALPIYLSQSWGDLGLGTWQGTFMVAGAIACAGKLAVATGQWRGGSLLKSKRKVARR